MAKLTNFDRIHASRRDGGLYGSKGQRYDVDGWLPPCTAADFLTEYEKVRFGIPKRPLGYEHYVAMLDVDAYKRNHDPLLFLVMRFALETMAYNDVHVQKEDILRVYEAQVGLEPFAVRLLSGKLSSADAMRLVRTYGDDKLFAVLPEPKPADKAYILFLGEQANVAKWPTCCRQDAYKLLFAEDEKTFRKPYREFLLRHVKTAKDWVDRARLYGGLVVLRDDESMAAVREGPVSDPITDCRESILYYLKERGEVTSAIDAILVIADRRDRTHRGGTLSRGAECGRTD